MTLISRHVSIEYGVQVITVNDFIIRPNMKLVAREGVNRVAVIKGIRFEKMTEYDAQIPPAKSRLSHQTVHRESLVIQADYDAHIPPSKNHGQYRESIEIQPEYDARIPHRLDRLHAGLIKSKPNMSLKARQNIQASPSISKQLLSAISRLHSYKTASHFETLLSTTLPKTPLIQLI